MFGIYSSKKFLFKFLVALGLHCFSWAFSSCREWELLSFWCLGFSLRWLLLWSKSLGAWASVVTAYRLSYSQHVESSWTRMESVSTTLAGRFLATVPQGKSCNIFLSDKNRIWNDMCSIVFKINLHIRYVNKIQCLCFCVTESFPIVGMIGLSSLKSGASSIRLLFFHQYHTTFLLYKS